MTRLLAVAGAGPREIVAAMRAAAPWPVEARPQLGTDPRVASYVRLMEPASPSCGEGAFPGSLCEKLSYN